MSARWPVVVAVLALTACSTPSGGEVPVGGSVDLVVGHPVRSDSLALSPDGRRLAAACGHQGEVCVWTTSSGRLSTRWPGTSPVAWSPTGSLVAVGSADGAGIDLLDPADGHVVRMLADDHAPPDERPSSPGAAAFSPDGSLVARASRGRLQVWSTSDGSVVQQVDLAAGASGGLAFDPDGARVAVAGAGAPTQLVTLADGAVRDLPVAGSASDAAFSPDGRRLAVAGDRVRVLDAASLAVLATLPGRAHVSRIAFAPDGSLVATTGVAGPVRWSPSPGDVVRLPSRGEPPRAVAVSPDGRTVYAVDTVTGVHAWSSDGRRRDFETPPA